MKKPDNVRQQGARTLRDDAGLIVCSCGCGRHPKPPRKTWFSQECVDEWLCNNNPGRMRELVYKRDRGRCHDCGINASKAFAVWKDARRETIRLVRWFIDRHNQSLGGRRGPEWVSLNGREVTAWIERIHWNPGWTIGRSTGWDADHILPVVMGGGNGGLKNLRTLCHPCHKRRTRELAAARAAARKPALADQPLLL